VGCLWKEAPVSGRCLSPVILEKKKTLCIIYLLVTRPAHAELGEKRDRRREREREWSERLKRATRSAVSFGCLDEENKVGN
jgi:hypothetical protein